MKRGIDLQARRADRATAQQTMGRENREARVQAARQAPGKSHVDSMVDGYGEVPPEEQKRIRALLFEYQREGDVEYASDDTADVQEWFEKFKESTPEEQDDIVAGLPPEGGRRRKTTKRKAAGRRRKTKRRT